MCDMQYHVCECGAEYPCYQRNEDCQVYNGYPERCNNCEYWEEEVMRDEERKAQRKWEEDEWYREHKIE